MYKRRKTKSGCSSILPKKSVIENAETMTTPQIIKITNKSQKIPDVCNRSPVDYIIRAGASCNPIHHERDRPVEMRGGHQYLAQVLFSFANSCGGDCTTRWVLCGSSPFDRCKPRAGQVSSVDTYTRNVIMDSTMGLWCLFVTALVATNVLGQGKYF